ncbi:MAG: hypothetical protein QHC89_08975 [Bosea sp. (in: a-proteobacteria)]|nr:hypothetical protein [Bosea sp. (in: a-proteobacteria)]
MTRETTMPFNEFGFQEVEYERSYRQFAAPFLIEGNAASNLFFMHEAQIGLDARTPSHTAPTIGSSRSFASGSI